MNQEWNPAPPDGHELEHPGVVALPDHSPENKDTLNTSGTFSRSPFYYSTPANGPEPLAPQTPPDSGSARTNKRITRLRKRPATRLLAGSVLSLKAWQLDMDWPLSWRAYVEQTLTHWLMEKTGRPLPPETLFIRFISENPAVDSNGHEHYDRQLSLTELAALSFDPEHFLALIKHVEPDHFPEGATPALTTAMLIEHIMKAPWTRDYQTLLESFWDQHQATWCTLAKLSFLDGLERQFTQKKISQDGYRLGLDALGLQAFPTDIEVLDKPVKARRAVISMLSVDDRLVPGLFQVRSAVTEHCFIHTLGDTPSCVEYISSDLTLMRQKMLDVLNASPSLAPFITLAQRTTVPVVLALVHVEDDLFQTITAAQRAFSVDRLEIQDIESGSEAHHSDDALLLPINRALTLVSAIGLWQGSSAPGNRIPKPEKIASRLMRNALATHHQLEVNPDHVFIRYLRGTSTTPLGNARNPANQVHVPSETPITLTEALLNNYRVERPVGYLDNGGRTAVYNDPTNKGQWQQNTELPITAQAIEDLIKGIDFLKVMSTRLDGFWDKYSASIEQSFKTSFIAQALVGLKQGHLTRAGFNLLVKVLEATSANTLAPDIDSIALGFHVRGSLADGTQCLACPGLLTFTERNQPLTVLYQAGQSRAFVELHSRDELERHLLTATQDEHWRETLLQYVPVSHHAQLQYLLEIWAGQRTPDATVSLLRPWTDPIYNDAIHKAQARVFCEQRFDYSPFVFMQKKLRLQHQANADHRIVTASEISLRYWAQQVRHLQLLLTPLAFLFQPAALASLVAQGTQLALSVGASQLPGQRDAEKNQVFFDLAFLGLLQLGPATPRLLGLFRGLTTHAKTLSTTVAVLTAETRGFSALLNRSLHVRNTRLEAFFNNGRLLKTWNMPGHPSFGTLPVKVWKLDHKFLLWTSDRGQARTLVVSTHGTYLPWTRTTAIPNGSELRTYAPHGYELVDPGLHRVVSQRARPFSILNPVQNHAVTPANLPPYALSDKALAGTALPGRIKNYMLSKFQSTHGETYQQISQVVRNSNLTPLTGVPVTPMDVLTVRNRFGMTPPTLEHLFKTLSEKGIHYDNILLLHCRCSALSSLMGRSPVYRLPPSNPARPVTP